MAVGCRRLPGPKGWPHRRAPHRRAPFVRKAGRFRSYSKVPRPSAPCAITVRWISEAPSKLGQMRPLRP